MNNSSKLEAIDKILDGLPKLQCQRKCQEACGPVLMTRLEWKRIIRTLGHEPKALPNLTCPMLKDGACSCYSVRPTICHLYGLVKAMACPWGCVPERWLSDEESHAILDAVSKIGNSP
jgi:Fe-S-cluster containining protein